MRLVEAKARVLAMMQADAEQARLHVDLVPHHPGFRDPAKFLLAGLPARVILRFSGWHSYLGPDWFDGLFSMPRINGEEFYWYVFYIPAYSGFRAEHYFVCDFKQMRDWALEFAAPQGDDHRDHLDWLCYFDRLQGVDERTALFRWGDEPKTLLPSPSRVITLDNAAALDVCEHHVGAWGPGGESAAHRLLKEYVALRPQLLGLSTRAQPFIEHPFITGDRVDLLFDNHGPRRSVVEVEIEGEPQVVVGIHQAIKYRSLAAAADRYALTDPTVRAYVVAYETAYPEATRLARDYDVRLVSVDRRNVLRRVA